MALVEIGAVEEAIAGAIEGESGGASSVRAVPSANPCEVPKATTTVARESDVVSASQGRTASRSDRLDHGAVAVSRRREPDRRQISRRRRARDIHGRKESNGDDH